MENTKDKPSISPKLIRRVTFDWFLLVGVYLSYVLFTVIHHSDEIARSLSGLGWRAGNIGKLIFYVLFTIGFLIYQMRLFIKLSGRKHRLINWMMIVGAFFMVLGSSFPIKDNQYIPNVSTAVDVLHTVFGTIGIGIVVVTISLMVIAYCRETKGTLKQKAMIFVPFIALLVIGGVGFVTTTAGGDAFATVGENPFLSGIFTLMATFMAMVYVQYLTVCFEVAEKEPAPTK